MQTYSFYPCCSDPVSQPEVVGHDLSSVQCDNTIVLEIYLVSHITNKIRYPFPPWGVLYIFSVRGRAIGKGIDFHDFGIRNGINFRNFHNLYRVGYAFSENWYKVGYIFLKNWYKVGHTFWKNWYKERVCF